VFHIKLNCRELAYDEYPRASYTCLRPLKPTFEAGLAAAVGYGRANGYGVVKRGSGPV